jgi:hypothetical protein
MSQGLETTPVLCSEAREFSVDDGGAMEGGIMMRSHTRRTLQPITSEDPSSKRLCNVPLGTEVIRNS